MTMPTPGDPAASPPWQAGIDPRLVARLVRVQRPGLIGLGLARRILGAVDALAGRLPLLARFPRAAADRATSSVPIVHVVPAGTPRADGGAPSAAPVTRAELPGRAAALALPVAPGRIIERRVERTIVERGAGADPRAQGGVAAAPGAVEPRLPAVGRHPSAERDPAAAAAAPLVHTHGRADAARADGAAVAAASQVGAQRVERTVDPVEGAAIAAPVAPGRADDAARAAAGPVVVERVREQRPEPAMTERMDRASDPRGDSPGAAARSAGSTDRAASIAQPPAPHPPVVAAPVSSDARGRRSRMGAPLVRPRALEAAPSTAPVEHTLVDRPGAARPELERPRPALRGAIARGRSVAPAGRSPDVAEIEGALPRVAPRRARPADAPRSAAPGRAAPRVATVVPRHVAAPAAGAAALVVVAPQTQTPVAARAAAGTPLAHVAPPAPAPVAGGAGAAAPATPRGPVAAPQPQRPITAGGAPGASPPALDLRQIAAGVQQIFARQAEHERARRGIRRGVRGGVRGGVPGGVPE